MNRYRREASIVRPIPFPFVLAHSARPSRLVHTARRRPPPSLPLAETVTTLAIGEESGPGPTTLALGEEDGTVTTMALGEESGFSGAAPTTSPFGSF